MGAVVLPVPVLHAVAIAVALLQPVTAQMGLTTIS